MLPGQVRNDSINNPNFSHWDHFQQNSCINRRTAFWPLNGKPVISVNDGLRTNLSRGYTAWLYSVCRSHAQHRRFHADHLCRGFVFPERSNRPHVFAQKQSLTQDFSAFQPENASHRCSTKTLLQTHNRCSLWLTRSDVSGGWIITYATRNLHKALSDHFAAHRKDSLILFKAHVKSSSLLFCRTDQSWLNSFGNLQFTETRNCLLPALYPWLPICQTSFALLAVLVKWKQKTRSRRMLALSLQTSKHFSLRTAVH